jgi:serine/threonine protein kinase
VIHRDLKASNVLLTDVDLSVASAQIADFGVATALTSLVTDTYTRGASEWAAPETFSGRFSFASDAYSFSILLFEVLSRKVPFHNLWVNCLTWSQPFFFSRALSVRHVQHPPPNVHSYRCWL